MFQYLNIFGVKLGTFPLFAGAGLLAIAFCVAYQVKNFNFDNDTETKVMVCIPLSVLFGTITAYFSDVIFRGGIRALFAPWGYGVTFYGWLIGCVFFYLIYSCVVHIKTIFLLNCFLPSFAIAQALGRIGCFCGGCCFGVPVNWGVCYPEGSYPYSIYGDIPILPVQLLESFYLFLIFFILMIKIKFSYRAAIYLILVPCGRFVFEFLRGDNRGSIGVQILSPAQLFSIVLILFGFILFLYCKRQEVRLP